MEAPTSDPVASAQPPETKPQISLTFLLVSGNRWTLSFDPEATIGRVKEIVWNSWPAEWTVEQPPSPSFLRILYLGKILQDSATVASQFPPNPPSTSTSPPSESLTTPSHGQPTIVHLSVRSFAPGPEDDISKSKTRRRSGSGGPGEPADDDVNSSGCCGCIIC